PETLITTDPDAAAAFWDRHGDVIYKSVSGVRSQVSRLRTEHRERLADVSSCPTQFQAWVPGRDHRVHVVGDEVFGVEVISDADDYRYASAGGHSCELRAVLLPFEVAERARALACALDLPVAGIDLRRTPDGRWYCFEVNSSPCFTYYEHHTGQPIAAALAAYLAAAHQ
ncbi:MAG: ATP-grasp domain-containing protein, partial [Kofleriaceae bacterium]